MEFFQRLNKRSLTSWAVSFAMHVLLLVLFLLIRVFMPPEIPEYSEMDFISIPTITGPALAQAPSVSTPASEETPDIKPYETPENLALPKMKHLPDEQPQLTERQVEKIAPTEKPFGGQVEPEVGAPEREERYPISRSPEPGEKPTPQAQRFTVGEKPQAGEGEGEDESKNRPYTIEGAVSARQIVTEVLPEYPLGLNKEAVIKIRFTVLPNGSVGEMVPLQKGEATLEEITMKAFRRWRFNPLPPDIPQVSQTGVITFRYLLK